MAERDEEGFLGRWARRKQQTGEAAPPPDAAAAGAPDAGDADASAAGAEADDTTRALTPEEVAALPDVDSMDADSDFTVFLREGVPDALRRRALRRLWRLNPLFAHLDGLNEYDEDFNDIKLVGDAVQTIYKAGRGYFAAEDKKTPVQPSEDNPLPAWEVAESDDSAEGDAGARGDAGAEGGDGAEEGDGAATRRDPGPAGAEQRDRDVVIGGDGPGREGPGLSAPGRDIAADAILPPATEEAVSAAAEARPDKRPPGSALRRRWGAS